jgi:hypothetical protein
MRKRDLEFEFAAIETKITKATNVAADRGVLPHIAMLGAGITKDFAATTRDSTAACRRELFALKIGEIGTIGSMA